MCLHANYDWCAMLATGESAGEALDLTLRGRVANGHWTASSVDLPQHAGRSIPKKLHDSTCASCRSAMRSQNQADRPICRSVR